MEWLSNVGVLSFLIAHVFTGTEILAVFGKPSIGEQEQNTTSFHFNLQHHCHT